MFQRILSAPRDLVIRSWTVDGQWVATRRRSHKHSRVSFQVRVGAELQADRWGNLPISLKVPCTTPETDEVYLKTFNRVDERVAGAAHNDRAWTGREEIR